MPSTLPQVQCNSHLNTVLILLEFTYLTDRSILKDTMSKKEKWPEPIWMQIVPEVIFTSFLYVHG